MRTNVGGDVLILMTETCVTADDDADAGEVDAEAGDEARC
jgi:hypothetical protein